jgi:hypothetical protein
MNMNGYDFTNQIHLSHVGDADHMTGSLLGKEPELSMLLSFMFILDVPVTSETNWQRLQ